MVLIRLLLYVLKFVVMAYSLIFSVMMEISSMEMDAHQIAQFKLDIPVLEGLAITVHHVIRFVEMGKFLLPNVTMET